MLSTPSSSNPSLDEYLPPHLFQQLCDKVTQDLCDKVTTQVLTALLPKVEEMIERIIKKLLLSTHISAPNDTHTEYIEEAVQRREIHVNAEKLRKTMQAGQTIDPATLTRAMHAAILDQQTIIEKSRRAVIEKLPEEIDECALIRQIAIESGVSDDLLEGIHRHPKEANLNGRARIIKVPFATTKARNNFIYNFRKSIRSLNIPHKITVRRDMTRSELDILYANRKSAYDQNKQLGLFKFVALDLSIITLTNPQPFKVFERKND